MRVFAHLFTQKCHLKRYHSDIKYPMTLKIVCSLPISKGQYHHHDIVHSEPDTYYLPPHNNVRQFFSKKLGTVLKGFLELHVLLITITYIYSQPLSRVCVTV